MGENKKIEVVIPVYVCDASLYPIIENCFDVLSRIDGLDENSIIAINDSSPLACDPTWPIKIQNEANQGFTKTVNKGLRASTAEVVVVMNDDIILTQECFDRFAQMKGSLIASPMDTAASNDDRFGSCWGITKEAINKLGYLDEQYRNYWSDLDYYQRAKTVGVEIIKWHDITLEHPESSTFKTLDKGSLLKADTKIWERNLE